MRKGKYSRNGSKRTLTVLLALVLVLCCGIGGTLAYLTAKTSEVTNTFVVGNIGTLTLTETEDDGGESHNYVIVPGVDLEKDPVVTYTPVTASNDVVQVPAYVFVEISTGTDTTNWTVEGTKYSIKLKIDGKGNLDATNGTETTMVEWEVNTAEGAWTAVPDADNVYYKALAASDSLDGLAVIKDSKIKVSPKITKDTIDDVATAAQNISFTAYAIQQGSFEDDAEGTEGGKTAVTKAWEAVKAEAIAPTNP